MSNLTKYLVIVGIMIAIGAMLLIYGSQTITGDLVIEEGKINSLTQLEIKAELDPEINTQGVYAVQTIEGKEYDISASVIDPSQDKIRDVSINRNSFEDNFEIDNAGTYTLIITTSESEEIPLVGGIGHLPDSTGVTISIAGFIIIVLGMIGVAVIGFMIIRQRKNKVSSDNHPFLPNRHQHFQNYVQFPLILQVYQNLQNIQLQNQIQPFQQIHVV